MRKIIFEKGIFIYLRKERRESSDFFDSQF